MTEWNAYKIFANGKRAKKPYCSFKSETKDYFYQTLLPSMSEKLQKSDWQIIDNRLPQEIIEEQPVIAELDQMIKKRNMFLSSIIEERYPDLETHKHQSCLMFAPETNWKWCWCVAEASTMNYVAQLSDRFETASEAEKWMKDNIGE